MFIRLHLMLSIAVLWTICPCFSLWPLHESKRNKLMYFIVKGPRSDNIPGQPVQGPERAAGPLHLAAALLSGAQPGGNCHQVGAVSSHPYYL